MAWRERCGPDGARLEEQYEYAVACSCGSSAYAFVDARSAEAVGAPVEVFQSPDGDAIDVRGELAELAKVRAWEKLRRAADRGGCDACREAAERWADGSLFFVEHLPREVVVTSSVVPRAISDKPQPLAFDLKRRPLPLAVRLSKARP